MNMVFHQISDAYLVFAFLLAVEVCVEGFRFLPVTWSDFCNVCQTQRMRIGSIGAWKQEQRNCLTEASFFQFEEGAVRDLVAAVLMWPTGCLRLQNCRTTAGFFFFLIEIFGSHNFQWEGRAFFPWQGLAQNIRKIVNSYSTKLNSFFDMAHLLQREWRRRLMG